MSLTKEYEELNKERLEDGEKSRKHYLSVNLPGDRTKGVQTENVRARIAAMKKEREKSNQDKK